MNQKFNLIILICLSIIYLTSCQSAGEMLQLENRCTIQYDQKDIIRFYDLRSLSLRSGYQKIKDNNDTYLINICAGKNEFKNEAENTPVCHKSASICLLNDEFPNGLELGRYTLSKLVVNNTTLNPYMLFENVNIGPKDRETLESKGCQSIHSIINFVCNKTRALENKPTFINQTKEDGDCTYHFEWKTSEACADEHTIIEPHYGNESLIFSIGDKKMNLDEIIVPQKVHGKYENGEEYDFIIKQKEYFQGNVSRNQYNASLTSCDDSFVCQLKTNREFVRPVGKFTNTTLKHAYEGFHLIMSSQSKCGRAKNKTAAVIFNLYCNETLAQPKTEFKAENNLCHYIFDVFSKEICPFEKLIKETNITDGMKASTANKSTIGSTIGSTSTTPASVSVTSEKPKVDNSSKTEDIVTTGKPKVENSKSPSLKIQSNKDDNKSENSSTNLFGFIILVIVSVFGIVFAVLSLLNDDRRSWLQKHLRRIKPQHTKSFHYSQVHSDSSRLVPLDSVQEE